MQDPANGIPRKPLQDECCRVFMPTAACTGTAPYASAARSSSSVHELCLHPILDPVPHPAEDLQTLFLRALNLGGVLEGPVQPAPGPREERAGFVRVVADGDHIIDGLLQIPIQGLRLLARDVYADLLHCPDGEGPYAGGLRARAHRLEAVAGKVPEQPLRYLRACGVVGAKEQDSGPVPRLSSSHRPRCASRPRRSGGRRPHRAARLRPPCRGSRSSTSLAAPPAPVPRP